MLGSLHNGVLKRGVKFHKVGAVPGDPNHQRGVLSRVFLGVRQNLFVHDVKLDVFDPQCKRPTQECQHLLLSLGRRQVLPLDIHVDGGAAADGVVVDLAVGADGGGGAVDIHAHVGTGGIAQWLARLSSAGQGPVPCP